jgi:tRNA pseudouridine55 synthase
MQINFTTQNYWINLEKPAGISSAKAVAIVKRLTRAKKVGHGGTLDPFADGILPIAVNRATKTAESMMQARKKYSFRIQWGEFRDSDDIEGKVEQSSTARPQTAEIIAILPQFMGKTKQTPSKFSAIKINGERAYNLAREGIAFEMKLREVEIFSLKLISNNQDFCEIEVACSKGTYVRTLARDIATKLGVCGFVSQLTRLEVGDFIYENKISLERLKNMVNFNEKFLDGSLLLLQDAT